jgi:hypothetical protein
MILNEYDWGKKIPRANSQNHFRCDFYNLPGKPPEFLPITLNEVECNEEMIRAVHGRLCKLAGDPQS